PCSVRIVLSRVPRRPSHPLFPYTTLFRSRAHAVPGIGRRRGERALRARTARRGNAERLDVVGADELLRDRAIESARARADSMARSEEHTSELQSPYDLVCRLLPEKKKNPS